MRGIVSAAFSMATPILNIEGTAQKVAGDCLVVRSFVPMTLFWGFVFLVVAFGLCLLFLLLLAFETRRSDVDVYKLSRRIGPLLFKMRHYLWSSAAGFSILAVQGALSVGDAARKHAARRSGNEEADLFFWDAIERFRAQRNMYIVICGLAIYLGIIAIAYQSKLSTRRIEQERAKLKSD
jgi:hypothetical protein